MKSRPVGLVLLAGGLFAIVSAFLIVQATSAGSMDEYCYEALTPPDNLDPSPEGQFGGTRISFFPFGQGCDWLLADGSRDFVPTNNPIPTIGLYGGAIALIVGLVLVARPKRVTSA